MESWTTEEVALWAAEFFSPEVAECFEGMKLRTRLIQCYYMTIRSNI